MCDGSDGNVIRSYFFKTALLAQLPLVITLYGCAQPTQEVSIRFFAAFDGAPIRCDRPSGPVSMTDLRMYVHSVELRTRDSEYVPVRLRDDGIWQDGAVALIDLEDGTNACLNGTLEMHSALQGFVKRDLDLTQIDGLRFEIGVPTESNHQDPTLAMPPLNYTIMHWHWRSGYKFLRAGVETQNDAAWMHLGSARCAGTIGAIEGCAVANRPTVELDVFDPIEDHVVIDLARLFGPSRLDDGAPWSCESGPDENHCRPVFAELGLEFASGRTLGPAPAFYGAARR